jgi:hypothetical protein
MIVVSTVNESPGKEIMDDRNRPRGEGSMVTPSGDLCQNQIRELVEGDSARDILLILSVMCRARSKTSNST